MWVWYVDPLALSQWKQCELEARTRQQRAGKLAASPSLTPQPVATDQSRSIPSQASASDLVKDAFFAKAPPEPGRVFRRDGSDLPPKVQEFDAEKDGTVIFYYLVKQAYKTFQLRTAWYDPSGALFDTFSRALDQTQGSMFTWFYTINVVKTDRIKEYPGTWTVELFIDDQPVGKYSFRLNSKADYVPRPTAKAERPRLQVGDRWIRSDGLLELARMEGDSFAFKIGADREVYTTRNQEVIKSISRGETVLSYDPPFPLFQWPLEVGKQWTYVGKQINKVASFEGTIRSIVRVVAYEDVSTPAGQFKAFKISTGRTTWWYSPEARTVVKYLTTIGGVGQDYVLVAFDRAFEQSATAGTPGRQSAGPDTRPLSVQDFRPYYTDSWAVVIGIDQYRHAQVPRLGYAVADARAVAHILPHLGFPQARIIVLEDAQATKAALEQALYGSLASMGKDDRLFVFFAGHGVTQTIKGGAEGYLLPVDADPTNLPLTGLAMRDLVQIGKRLPPKHIFFALDTCFSGYAVTRDVAVQAQASPDLVALTREPVVQILTAGTQGQRVIEERGHGLFTKHFLKGLEGWADLPGTGLTAVKLAAYIQERVVQDSAGAQTPQYGKLDGEGEFLFRPPRR
jgi:hypothetical protein